MIRCTIEILPGGSEERKRTIGLVEICNTGGTDTVGEYAVVLKKTPPFAGALKRAWRAGRLSSSGELIDSVVAGEELDEIEVAKVEGHPRYARGVYDLLYRALKACGLEDRVPAGQR